MTSRLIVTKLSSKLILSSLIVAASLVSPAHAEENRQAKYRIALAGIPFARLTLNVTEKGNGYSIGAFGKVSGLAKIITSGKGEANSSGSTSPSRLHPATFSLVTIDKKRQSSKFSFANSKVTGLSVSPAVKSRADRIPLAESHKTNVIDPLSALVIKSEKGFGPHICQRTIPVFDGRQRYDIKLNYLKTQQTRGGKKSYNGPSVLCQVKFNPIAGHRKNSKMTNYMKNNNKIFIWYIPMSNNNKLFIPYRVDVDTKMGKLVFRMSRLKDL